MVPTESSIAIGPIRAAEAGTWSVISQLLVPYGGLLAIKLEAGETLVVSGATGNFGSAGVAVALAMGAGRVVVLGRNETMLAELERRFGSRVAALKLTGDEGADRDGILQAAQGHVDAVLDLLPPTADVRAVRTAAMSVREFGRVALMGGVGMGGGADLPLPYPWVMRNGITLRGQWMYPRAAVTGMLRLIRAGLVDLKQWEIRSFPLEDVNDAVGVAKTWAGPFKAVVLTP